MDEFACALIKALGGATATARMMSAPVTTVQNMKRRLTPSRLDHLRRIAEHVEPPVNVEAIAEKHGVDLPPIVRSHQPSPGNTERLSDQVSA